MFKHDLNQITRSTIRLESDERTFLLKMSALQDGYQYA